MQGMQWDVAVSMARVWDPHLSHCSCSANPRPKHEQCLQNQHAGHGASHAVHVRLFWQASTADVQMCSPSCPI